MPKPKGPVALIYIGPAIVPGGGIPLPQGWPAIDHAEPDDELRAAKLASGFYEITGVAPAEEG